MRAILFIRWHPGNFSLYRTSLMSFNGSQIVNILPCTEVYFLLFNTVRYLRQMKFTEERNYFFTTLNLVCFIFFLTLTACDSSPKSTSAGLLDDEKNGEAISFLGETFFRPEDDSSTFLHKDSLLLDAITIYQTDTTDLNSIIWYGRRLVSMYRFKDAIDIFSRGIKIHPNAPELYRHRGQQYITLRLPGLAIDDLRKAAALSDDRNIETEPDVVPNKLDLPISNLRFNIYYYLGLAWYIKGDFKKAIESLSSCHPYAINPDLKITEAYWLCLSFLRTDMTVPVDSILLTIDPYAEIIERDAYFRTMLNFKTAVAANRTAIESQDSITTTIELYGNCIWYEGYDHKTEAADFRRRILQSADWIDIGYIAAEADSSRLLVQ